MPAVEARSKPIWTPEEVSVIFVLGGPGAGKGTQCEKLVKDYGFKHISAGDLLREEQDRPGSEFGKLIKELIKEGKIVPQHITIKLLENAIRATINNENKRQFLIDGFPRKMDQALSFEETIVSSRFTLFFDCPEEVMQDRLLNRGKTSGRSDDNIESIKKRFKVFVETSMPVVDHFEKDGRVIKIEATTGPDDVYKHVQEKFKERGFNPSA